LVGHAYAGEYRVEAFAAAIDLKKTKSALATVARAA
jgi:hypothetical protein